MLASVSAFPCPKPAQPVSVKAPITSASIAAKSLPLVFVAAFPPAVSSSIVVPPAASRHDSTLRALGPCGTWASLLHLFTEVRGSGILRTSPFGDSRKFEFTRLPTRGLPGNPLGHG